MKRNAYQKDGENQGGEIPNSVFFLTHRAPNRGLRDACTLKHIAVMNRHLNFLMIELYPLRIIHVGKGARGKITLENKAILIKPVNWHKKKGTDNSFHWLIASDDLFLFIQRTICSS